MTTKRQLINAIDDALKFALSNMHTATIARVVTVNETTLDVQPVISRTVDGKSITLPVFTKVPPLFMQGGGSYTAHPIAPGDYCLLIITERCFDRWYEGQDEVSPAEFRMHDYSDGIAIVGLNPKANAITIPDVIQQTGDSNQDGNCTHQGNRTQTGDYTLSGDIDHTGNEIRTGTRTQTGDDSVTGNITATGSITGASIAGTTFSVAGQSGASGSFITVDGKTVLVVSGIITSIV